MTIEARKTAREMVETLRAAGCRITRQRRAIVECLAGRDDHPSARQVFLEASAREPGLSLATVYNTLATLVEAGLLAELGFGDADNRYDPNIEPHLNLVCTSCGAIVDLVLELPVSAAEVRRRTGFRMLTVRMEYRGLCVDCAAHTTTDGRKDRGTWGAYS